MTLMKRRRDLWDPLMWVGDLREEMDRALSRSLFRGNGSEERLWEPEIDLLEEKDGFLVKADVPGLKKEEFHIKVEGKLLTLQGERKQEKEIKEKNYYASERFYGTFSRMIELPTEIKTEAVKATYKDGVLEISLPKSEGAKSKEISIEIK